MGYCDPPTPVVYFIGSESVVKVGFATRLRTRFASLKTDSPIPVRILGSIPGDENLECAFHRFLRGDRLHGEWFRGSMLLTFLIGCTRIKSRELTDIVMLNKERSRRKRFAPIRNLAGFGNPASSEKCLTAYFADEKNRRFIRRVVSRCPRFRQEQAELAKGRH